MNMKMNSDRGVVREILRANNNHNPTDRQKFIFDTILINFIENKKWIEELSDRDQCNRVGQ